MYPPFPSSLNTLSQTGAHIPPVSDFYKVSHFSHLTFGVPDA